MGALEAEVERLRARVAELERTHPQAMPGVTLDEEEKGAAQLRETVEQMRRECSRERTLRFKVERELNHIREALLDIVAAEGEPRKMEAALRKASLLLSGRGEE